MHEVMVNRLGGLSLPRKSVARLTDRPDMTIDVYRGRKTTMQQQPKRTCSPVLQLFTACTAWSDYSYARPPQPGPIRTRLCRPCIAVIAGYFCQV